MTAPTFRRVDEDTYDVLVHGRVIGQVFKGYWRLGGTGWSCTGRENVGHPTRKAAVARLLRDVEARS